MFIKLPCGRSVELDDADSSLVVGKSWRSQPGKNGDFYAVYTLNRRPLSPILIRMHRVIVGAGDGQLVDHRDGNGLNNKRLNLRVATTPQNMQNRAKRTEGQSSFKGVCPSGRRWRARIGTGNTRITLGFFSSEDEAARAYDAAAREAFGEFARLNFPLPHEQPATGAPI